MIKMGLLKFMHSVHFSYAPKSFNNTWTTNNVRDLNVTLRNNKNYVVPIPRTDLFKRLPMYSLPNKWNYASNLVFYETKITYNIALENQLFEELLTNVDT